MSARTHASVPWEAYIVCVCVCCAVKMDQQKCLLRTFCVCACRQAGTHARTRARNFITTIRTRKSRITYSYTNTNILYAAPVFVCHDNRTHTHIRNMCWCPALTFTKQRQRQQQLPRAPRANNVQRDASRAVFYAHAARRPAEARSSARKGFQIRSLTLVLQRIIQYFTQTAFHVHFSSRSRSIPAHI